MFVELYVYYLPGFFRFLISVSVESLVMWVGNNVFTTIVNFQINIVYRRKIKNRKKS